MKIRNTQQLHVLENAIDRCNHSVWLESVQGERYDMKDEQGRHEGLERLMSDTNADLGLYANDRADEAILMQACRQLVA